MSCTCQISNFEALSTDVEVWQKVTNDGCQQRQMQIFKNGWAEIWNDAKFYKTPERFGSTDFTYLRRKIVALTIFFWFWLKLTSFSFFWRCHLAMARLNWGMQKSFKHWFTPRRLWFSFKKDSRRSEHRARHFRAVTILILK